MESNPSHHREVYQKICAKALRLNEGADWKMINSIRNAILSASIKAGNDTEHHYPDDHQRLIQAEKERMHGIFLFDLDPNSAEMEVDHFSKISELSQNSESRKREVASLFRLPENTSWDEISKLFSYMKTITSRDLPDDQSAEEKIREYLNIPRELYKELVEIIELGGDLEELERIS